MVSKEEQTNKLALIPKSENYIEYMLQMILKLPRTEKYSIGTEYKQLLYIMLKDIIYLSKIQKECILEKSKYIDRIVHRWVVDNFLEPAFVPQFVNTSYACLKNKGMHKACLDVQKTMKHCKKIWNNYYILKMDVAKYFDNIDKKILLKIIDKKIKDKELMWLIKQILYSQKREKGLEIRELYFTNVCKYIFK